MKPIETLCEEFEQMTQGEFMLTLSKYMTKAMSTVNNADSEQDALSALGILACSSVVADDAIDDIEFTVLYNGLKATMGDKVDIDDCLRLAQYTLDNKDNFRESALDLAENYLAFWDKEDKESVIMFCIALCAIDRKVSDKEIDWLKNLISAAGI